MLKDARTGESREVDVVATATVGGYSIMISIEVRDHRRSADVTWVEQMAQKHADLPTSKLALWSASGFTKGALAKADTLKIETVGPGNVDAAPWATIARTFIGGTFKYVRPAFTPAVDVTLHDGSVERWDAPLDMVLTGHDGTQGPTIGAILEQISNNPEVRTLMLDHAPEGSGDFHMIYTPPIPCNVQGPNGEIGDVNRLVVGINTECEVSSVETRTAVYNQAATTLLESSTKWGLIQMVVQERADTPPVILPAVKPNNSGSQ
jgi:hypothetical protein